jgi:hypothetical protein
VWKRAACRLGIGEKPVIPHEAADAGGKVCLMQYPKVRFA